MRPEDIGGPTAVLDWNEQPLDEGDTVRRTVDDDDPYAPWGKITEITARDDTAIIRVAWPKDTKQPPEDFQGYASGDGIHVDDLMKDNPEVSLPWAQRQKELQEAASERHRMLMAMAKEERVDQRLAALRGELDRLKKETPGKSWKQIKAENEPLVAAIHEENRKRQEWFERRRAELDRQHGYIEEPRFDGAPPWSADLERLRDERRARWEAVMRRAEADTA